MTARHVDRAIEGLARRQHGAFHRRQALRLGATAGIIRRREDAGTWVRLGGQVFVYPSSPGTWQRQCMAGTLSVPGSALCGRAGLANHGVEGFPRARIEVVTRWGGTSRSPFATVRRTTAPIRARVVDGIRTVPLSRCLADLAPQLGAAALGDVLDTACHDRRWLLGDVRDDWVPLIGGRHPGCRELEEVLRTRDDGGEVPATKLERELRTLLASIPDLPPVVGEAPAPWIGPGRRVDAYVPDLGLVVEADGRAWHTRVADFEDDRWRDALAAAAGVLVVRVTWRRLTRDDADCRRVLRAIVAQRRCTQVRNPAA